MINEDSERRQIAQGETLQSIPLVMQRPVIALIIADSGISIHAAREGGDLVRIETHAEEEIAVITIRLRRRKCKISILVYLKLK